MSEKSTTIATADIQRHLDALAKIGNLGPSLEDGFLRAAWSDEESAAMQYIIGVAEEAGLQHRFDSVGNLFIRTPGGRAEVVQVGSHLDTVPRGGLFDGGAGIVAGLEAILCAQKNMTSQTRDMELVIWRGEESATFNALFMGSRAAFGQADADLLKNRFQGISLEDAIRGQGFDPAAIVSGDATLDQSAIDSIAGHIELHIEQANRLEVEHIDIGIVTSIRAPRRFRIFVRGENAHSGATPMGLPYRKDACLSMSHMHVRLHEALTERCAKGQDLVQTIGVINSSKDLNEAHPEVYENALTKVSSFGYFLLDIRGNTKTFLDEYTAAALEIIQATAEQFSTPVEIQTLAESDPVEQLDRELQKHIVSASEQLGHSHVLMPSGAGHDAAVVAKQQRSNGTTIPTAMIFIPCRDGISHNPLEYATTEAITKGAEVIAHVLLHNCS